MAADMLHPSPAHHVVSVRIAELMLDPANARLHDERNLAAIEASLLRFGQRKPVVIQRRKGGDLMVRAGNGLVQVASKLGWLEVAAVIVDEDDQQATAYAIADNRTAELSEWDWQQLLELFRGDPELAALDTGFSSDDLAKLLAKDDALSEFGNADKGEPGSFQCPECGYEWNGKPRP